MFPWKTVRAGHALRSLLGKRLRFLPLWCAALACAGLAIASPADVQADAVKDGTGYSLLVERAGDQLADGNGIKVAHVEALFEYNDGIGYAPDAEHAQFAGKTITPQSGTHFDSSPHGTIVGKLFYGLSDSLAPGVTEIDAYSNSGWMTDALGEETTSAPPDPNGIRVVNHSWVEHRSSYFAQDVLRRSDYLAERDRVLTVCGADNGADTGMPRLMASQYNGLTVGTHTLEHSQGPTLFDAPGRSKVDLICTTPEIWGDNYTSWSTPIVAGFSAALLQSADAHADVDAAWGDANRPEVIKSVLMASTQKLDGWSAINDEPLDRRQGAGLMRADRAWQTLQAGPNPAGNDANTAHGTLGWDYGLAGTDAPADYWIDLPTGATSLTANLTWLRRHEGSWPAYKPPAVTLDSLTLSLYDAQGTLLAESGSSIDNVAHLYLEKALQAGRYRLEVASSYDAGDPNERFGLAWYTRQAGDVNEDGLIDDEDVDLFASLTKATPPSEPGLDVDAMDFDLDGVREMDDLLGMVHAAGGSGPGDASLDGSVDVTDLAILAAHWESDEAVWSMGDFNADGSVDVTDLAALAANWQAESSKSSRGGAIPEPSSIAMLCLLGSACLRRGRR